MSIPAERLPNRPRKTVNRAALARKTGLVEPLRLTQGITRGDMADTLRAAAEEAERTVRNGLGRGIGAQVRADQLRAATRGLTRLSDELWTAIHTQIKGGVKDAAKLAANHQLLRDLQMGLPRDIMKKLSGGTFFSANQAANDILSRHTNGFTLSQRVYRNSQAMVLQVGQIIDQSLAAQLSAREISRKVLAFISPNTPGGTSYAAMRLGRTEINNAHHDTTIRLSRDRPWVTGYQWHLSGSHPKPDECDELAHEDHSGMGEGVFRKGDVPSRPHPQCLCYLGVAQVPEQEFIRQLTSGRYDQYLQVQGA